MLLASLLLATKAVSAATCTWQGPPANVPPPSSVSVTSGAITLDAFNSLTPAADAYTNCGNYIQKTSTKYSLGAVVAAGKDYNYLATTTFFSSNSGFYDPSGPHLYGNTPQAAIAAVIATLSNWSSGPYYSVYSNGGWGHVVVKMPNGSLSGGAYDGIVTVLVGYEYLTNTSTGQVSYSSFLYAGVNIDPSTWSPLTSYALVTTTTTSYVPTNAYTGNPKEAGNCDCEQAQGNPINAGTGNKIQNEVDFKGTGPFPLLLTRTYNSQITSSFGFGVGWRTNYDRRIISPGTNTVWLSRPDGKQLTFTLVGGTWGSDADITGKLVQLTDNIGQTTGWLYNENDGSIEQYDALGMLTSITNRTGLSQTLTYSTVSTPSYIAPIAGLLIGVTDTFGRTLSFTYNPLAQVLTMTDPSGGTYTYAYDEASSITLDQNPNNNLTSVTYPGGGMRTYWYNEQDKTANTNLIHAFTGIVDENAKRYATWTYDASGKALSSEHGVGIEKVNLTYNAGNTAILDALGTSRIQSFSSVLGVTKSTGQVQPGGSGYSQASSAISYDTNNGNILFRTDFNQHKTCYTYDSSGRNLETARVEGLNSNDSCTTTLAAATLSGVTRKTSTAWHSYWRLPVKLAEPNRLTTWIYNGDTYQGSTVTCAPVNALIGTQPIAVLCQKIIQATTDSTGAAGLSATIDTTASARTWNYTYNGNGQVLTADGTRTDVADTTTYAYYSADDTSTPPKYRHGDLQSITDALGHVTQITQYDGNGRPLIIVDPNNATTTLTYWPRGWLHTKTVGSKTTTYEYDNVGQLIKVTLGDGSTIQYSYDDAHRLTSITDILLNRVQYTLDAMGNRIKEEVFDANNTLSSKKSRDFDPLNRLWHDIAYYNDPNTPVATQYTYDANGNLTTIVPPVNSTTDTTYRTTTFAYDALDRLQYVMDPINQTTKPTQYGFDGLDQLKNVTDPRGLITRYSVDGLGNVTQEISPDKGTTTRTLDEAGNVKTETDAKGTQTNYQYDALNRLTSVTQGVLPNTTSLLTYTWDTATGCTYGIGRLCQMTAAGSGATTNFAYDDQGNLVKKTRTEAGVSVVTQYAYDGANRRSTLMGSTGETMVAGRNTAGQINSLTTTNGTTTTLESQITYDGTGQVTSQTLGNGVILKASYDLSGQPSSERFNKHDGDINQDGVVNVVDVLFAQQIAAGLRTPTPDQLDHGDVVPAGNPDGKIDAVDVMRILRKAEKLENF